MKDENEIEDALIKYYLAAIIEELRTINKADFSKIISYNTMMYLNIIDCKDYCTISYIADMLNISKSAVTIKVNELVELSLVTKIQSEDDKRINYLAVTKAAEAIYASYYRKLYRAIGQIKENYTEGEIKMFCNMINILSDGYSKGDRDE